MITLAVHAAVLLPSRSQPTRRAASVQSLVCGSVDARCSCARCAPRLWPAILAAGEDGAAEDGAPPDGAPPAAARPASKGPRAGSPSDGAPPGVPDPRREVLYAKPTPRARPGQEELEAEDADAPWGGPMPDKQKEREQKRIKVQKRIGKTGKKKDGRTLKKSKGRKR